MPPRSDIFDFIELFYNSKRRHSHVGGVSPVQFEADYFKRVQSRESWTVQTSRCQIPCLYCTRDYNIKILRPQIGN